MGGIDDVVDTERYPLDPADPHRAAVVTQARAELAADGCTVLRDVIRPEVRERLRAEGAAVAPRAHTEVADVNVYNTDPDPSLPPGHPAGVRFRRRNAFVAHDHIPADHVMHRLYTDAGVRRLVADCAGMAEVHELADPFAGLTLNVVAPGDEHPWHFDTNEIAVSLLVAAPEAGGAFEYVPHLRSPGDENHAGVAAVLAGAATGVRRIVLRPGDLQLFRGRFALHRVAPVAGRAPRHTAILAYSTRPGVVNSAVRSRQLFGRVAPVHLTERPGALDALQD